MGKSYNKGRAMQQVNSVALKSQKLATGTKIVLKECIAGTRKTANGTEIPNDVFMCGIEGGKNVRIAVAELLRMTTQDGKDIFKTEDGQEAGEFPEALTVVTSKDRLGRDGKPFYPVQAYVLGEEFLREGSKLDWNGLVAGGVKPDNKIEPVQDYTVSI